jgi:hypothetical protein
MDDPSSAAPSADQDAAIRAQITCMRAMAAKLDDHRSGADVIGYAVAGACHAETEKTAYASQPTFGMSYDAFQSLKSRIEASSVQMATQVVLMERAAK